MDTPSSLCWLSAGIEVVRVSACCHCLYLGAAVTVILASGFDLGITVPTPPNLAAAQAEAGKSQGQGQPKKGFLEDS